MNFSSNKKLKEKKKKNIYSEITSNQEKEKLKA
jgi:hypothetical protein